MGQLTTTLNLTQVQHTHSESRLISIERSQIQQTGSSGQLTTILNLTQVLQIHPESRLTSIERSLFYSILGCVLPLRTTKITGPANQLSGSADHLTEVTYELSGPADYPTEVTYRLNGSDDPLTEVIHRPT